VAGDEPAGIETDRYFLSSSQPSELNPIGPCRSKDHAEVVGCRDVHRVVQARVIANSTAKASSATIDFTEQFDLEPALPDLDRFGWFGWAAEFRDPEQTYLPN
jgi:hypothetical protein